MLWLYIFGAFVVVFGVSVFFGAPYVPSLRKEIKRLFDKALPLSAADVVLDLGSGDGLVLREVSSRGARAVGYEIHPIFVLLSRILSRGDNKVQVRWADAWKTPFPDDVTKVYVFAVGRDGARVVKIIQREVDRLQRPLEVACYGNPLKDRQPTRTFEAFYLYSFHPLHLS